MSVVTALFVVGATTFAGDASYLVAVHGSETSATTGRAAPTG
jgi:hypothetical protein